MTLEYTKFTGQQSNSNTTSCISSQFSSSNWYENDCLQQKPFICELFISEPCPKDWLYWPYTNKCYSYQSGLPFYNASAFCQNLSATFLSEMADGYFNGSSDFWLGGFNSFVDETWAWSDYGNFSYTNWASGKKYLRNT